jgi:hypothetical protein
MSSLKTAKRYVRDAARKTKKGVPRTIEKRFNDLLKAVKHVVSQLEKK